MGKTTSFRTNSVLDILIGLCIYLHSFKMLTHFHYSFTQMQLYTANTNIEMYVHHTPTHNNNKHISNLHFYNTFYYTQ